MNKNKTAIIQISFSSPLNKEDSETETFGCRHTNPDICSKNLMPKVCAFVRDDKICKHPSRAWSKQFNILKTRTIDDKEMQGDRE